MITVTDLFCGAGGSSLGAEAVPGVQLVMAANHWSKVRASSASMSSSTQQRSSSGIARTYRRCTKSRRLPTRASTFIR